MNYSSKTGCLIYYDSVLCKQGLCEPTMLFLFGLEAVITNVSDYTMTVPVLDPETEEPIIDPVTGEVITEEKPNEYNLKTLRLSRDTVGELFDYIYRYLYHVPTDEPVTVDEIEYYCDGMKLFLNELTGTNTDRIVPVIFHEDYDAVTLGLPEDADFNTKAQKIIDVMASAGYDSGDSSIRLLSKYGVTDEATAHAIDEYNKEAESEHNKKKANGMIYKLLDYKAMYSYALGVLYGCKCLGYDDSIIWRSSPSYWYDGEYSNLVSTAYEVFQLHYTHPIPKIDCDPRLICKYKGIQLNKLWNFDNNLHNIKADEVLCHTYYIEDGNEISFPLFYSQSTGPQKMPPGSYLLVGESEWHPLDNTVIDDSTSRGIVADKDEIIIRYIANDEVQISKAYKYSKGKFLSPNRRTVHFVHTGNLGWVDYIEDSYKKNSDTNPMLTLVPVGFDNISSDLLKLARNKDDNSVIMYYHCYVTENNVESERRSLYGILPDDAAIESGLITVPDDTHFKAIVSDIYFTDTYEFPVEPEGYTLTPYFNISTPISIYVYNQDSTMMWNGGDIPVKIVDYGYTKTESESIEAYIDSPNDEPDLFDLRYNSDEEYGYWSNTWNPKQWKQAVDDDIFLKEDSITLYKNESVITTTQSYSAFNPDEYLYIFNNNSIAELAELQHGFIPLQTTVYNIGITHYECPIVYEDDFGNSLLDDYGNPLVWQDPISGQYWNGVYNINRWQNDKPSKFSKYIYNADTYEMKLVGVNEEDHLISVDGNTLTYDEFYENYTDYGVIRTKVDVFNENISTSSILECYVDTYIDKYCVPERTRWLTRSEMTEAGYRFVNGITGIFMGNNEIDVVYDTDPIDTPAHLED